MQKKIADFVPYQITDKVLYWLSRFDVLFMKQHMIKG